MAGFYNWAEDDWTEDSEAAEALADVLGSSEPEAPQVSEEFADLAGLLELVENQKGWAA